MSQRVNSPPCLSLVAHLPAGTGGRSPIGAPATRLTGTQRGPVKTDHRLAPGGTKQVGRGVHPRPLRGPQTVGVPREVETLGRCFGVGVCQRPWVSGVDHPPRPTGARVDPHGPDVSTRVYRQDFQPPQTRGTTGEPKMWTSAGTTPQEGTPERSECPDPSPQSGPESPTVECSFPGWNCWSGKGGAPQSSRPKGCSVLAFSDPNGGGSSGNLCPSHRGRSSPTCATTGPVRDRRRPQGRPCSLPRNPLGPLGVDNRQLRRKIILECTWVVSSVLPTRLITPPRRTTRGVQARVRCPRGKRINRESVVGENRGY